MSKQHTGYEPPCCFEAGKIPATAALLPVGGDGSARIVVWPTVLMPKHQDESGVMCTQLKLPLITTAAMVLLLLELLLYNVILNIHGMYYYYYLSF